MDIKTRDTSKRTIKTLDKAKIASEKFKNTILNVKDKTESSLNDTDSIYGESDKIVYGSRITSQKTVEKANSIGKKSFKETRKNVKRLNHRIKGIKSKRTLTKTKRIAKTNLKQGKIAFQKAAKHSKAVMKTTKQTAKLSLQALKNAAKASFHALKALVAGTKALISAIVAGGWIAVVIIIVVVIIAFLCTSVFGIFMSSEKISDSDITMDSVISEINEELNNKIIEFQNTIPHENYELVSNMARWEDLLAIYATKITNGNLGIEAITVNEEKKNILKNLFWQMNSLSTELKDKKDINGVVRKTLIITISSKSVDEMANLNMFTQEQRKELNELLSDKYKNLWSDVIYGKSVGNRDIVKIAEKQIGNQGGQKFWSWYGFSGRVEWCAIFVSWVANEAGYLNKTIPKFAACQNQGVVWFKSMSLWHERGFVPKSGDIIFFDWNYDGHSDHVGIVEKVSNGKVYTIEGNSSDRVQRQSYGINSKDIYGYGTPQY